MRPRTYALGLTTAAVALFTLTVAANLIVDPQQIFGTGVLGRPLNPNDRYQKFLSYEAQANSYDGLYFASSRGVVPLDELSRLMEGVRFANFSIVGGQIVDYLAILDYVIREKVAKRSYLSAVFVQLDIDSFGDRPIANRALQYYWPPELTGESPARFEWRYLTAIQFSTWWGEIGRTWKRWQTLGLISQASAQNSRDGTIASSPATPFELIEITARPDYPRQLALLKQFVATCRTRNVNLIVVLSPLHRNNVRRYAIADLERAVEDISRLVPVWDFGSPDWLSERRDLWFDESHFTPEVARMMLSRIFDKNMPANLQQFGRLIRR